MNIKKYIIQIREGGVSEDSVEIPSESMVPERVSMELVNEMHEIENKEDLNSVSEANNEDFFDNSQKILHLSDCGNWPIMRNNSLIDELIKAGPNKIEVDNYPKNEDGSHFASSYYTRKLPNGEVFNRRWLVYSLSRNCVFCFCCRILDAKCTSKFVGDGFNKWKNLSESLSIHENSLSHKKSYQTWIETEMRLKTGKTVDKVELKMIKTESLRWQSVLLFTPSNSKFLGLVKTIARFDPVMENHLNLAMDGKIVDHYCGPKIQNELIDIIAESIKIVIKINTLLAKYYSIIADCTPDDSRKEQLSLTVRFADVTSDTIEIKEHFIGFIN